MKKLFKNIAKTAKTAAINCQTSFAAFHRRAVRGNAGQGYIDTAVKVLIAVVLGALVLAGLYAALNHGGHDRVVQQSVETGQRQGAQIDGEQNRDGGIDIALSGGAAAGGAVEGGDGGLAVDGGGLGIIGDILEQLLHKVHSSYK